jgi:predicted outer membrane protein
MTIEGVGKQIYPELDVFEEVKPYFLKLFWARYSPEKMSAELVRTANKLSGAAFDKAYVDAQVTGHQDALAFLQRAENSAQNADLKKLISSAIPDVQKHLDRAKSLQSKVGL